MFQFQSQRNSPLALHEASETSLLLVLSGLTYDVPTIILRVLWRGDFD
jgi:hypothetical protein